MTLRPVPASANWFLNQFGSNLENESVLGDLTEQYQRGRGPVWYWRQVLAIVFMGLLGEVRSHKRTYLVGLFKTWCIWGGLQFACGVLLMARYVVLHWEQFHFNFRVYGFPMLALRAGMESASPAEWDISLLSIVLNLLAPFVVGRVIASVPGREPRCVLLMFVTSFVVATAGSTATQVVQLIQNHPDALAFLLLDLSGLLLAPALMLIGGMRGLSPVSPHSKR